MVAAEVSTIGGIIVILSWTTLYNSYTTLTKTLSYL